MKFELLGRLLVIWYEMTLTIKKTTITYYPKIRYFSCDRCKKSIKSVRIRPLYGISTFIKFFFIKKIYIYHL